MWKKAVLLNRLDGISMREHPACTECLMDGINAWLRISVFYHKQHLKYKAWLC